MTTDFTLVDHGSIVLITPESEAAVDWCNDHLPKGAQRWGDAYVIEPRYAEDIVHGLIDDGLTIEGLAVARIER